MFRKISIATVIVGAVATGGFVAATSASSQKAVKPTAAAASSWAGDYRGQFDGGKGSVKISPATNGRYKVRMDVIGYDGCAGGTTGFGAPVGPKLTLSIPDTVGGVCGIQITRNQDRLTVKETSLCTGFHGMLCAFDGTVKKGR